MKIYLIVLSFIIIAGCNTPNNVIIQNPSYEIKIINSDSALWSYKIINTKKEVIFKAPVFEIDGRLVRIKLDEVSSQITGKLKNGVTEHTVNGKVSELPGVTLKIVFRIGEKNPVLRFCYRLESTGSHKLTRNYQYDNISYLSFPIGNLQNMKEIRFSEFNEMVYSFCLSERNIETYNRDSSSFMGPMLIGSENGTSVLVAYEHGSQVPDRFLEYYLANNELVLKAVKGNYINGFKLSEGYQTVWFETALVNGSEENLASAYREFVLRYMSESMESRKPYIFYNTWNFQERNRNWYKKPYVADMTLPRMLKEIDAAHEIGIEVFVIDAGWFEKTGDWTPSLERFPDGLKVVKSKLEKYGMKLGLWFNPTVASISSNMYKNNSNCVRTMNGNKGNPWPSWVSEDSYGMCLVSSYRDAFADKLIQLNKELGVSYFKWDAIGQYECNDPHHYHGDTTITPKERLENYAFEIGRSMSYVVDKLVKACPEAIVDFDITEGTRAVGLGFLSSGKYFLVNNGPYYFNYNIPFDIENDNWNIFFYPGPARGWICRTPLTYDKWIPSVLFLTHYLPDDPKKNQSMAVGSLILGQNGIWGDLPSVSREGIQYFNKTLSYYKQVREDMTNAPLTRDGVVGGTPEIYEKINPATGKGAIVIFSSHGGSYEYISRNKVASSHWASEGTIVQTAADGKAKISATFNEAEAKIIYFGIK